MRCPLRLEGLRHIESAIHPVNIPLEYIGGVAVHVCHTPQIIIINQTVLVSSLKHI